ncbi:MAG: hypothetical protein ACOX2L_11620 [Anaerolineae bacterium]|jgi:alpha-galactosidase/6-phospho-beta-glucosidase family protein
MVKLVLIGGGSPFTPSVFQAIVENASALDTSTFTCWISPRRACPR